MPFLRYVGALDEVSVPHHQIPAAPRGRAVEVSQEAYDDLIDQELWEHADGPDPDPEPEAEAVEAPAVDDESEEG